MIQGSKATEGQKRSQGDPEGMGTFSGTSHTAVNFSQLHTGHAALPCSHAPHTNSQHSQPAPYSSSLPHTCARCHPLQGFTSGHTSRACASLPLPAAFLPCTRSPSSARPPCSTHTHARPALPPRSLWRFTHSQPSHPILASACFMHRPSRAALCLLPHGNASPQQPALALGFIKRLAHLHAQPAHPPGHLRPLLHVQPPSTSHPTADTAAVSRSDSLSHGCTSTRTHTQTCPARDRSVRTDTRSPRSLPIASRNDSYARPPPGVWARWMAPRGAMFPMSPLPWIMSSEGGFIAVNIFMEFVISRCPLLPGEGCSPSLTPCTCSHGLLL